MILDGYTLVSVVSGRTIVHRTLPAEDRRALSELVRPLDNGPGLRVMQRIASQLIVQIDGAGPLSLQDCVKVIQSPTEKADLANLREGLAIVKQFPHMAELECRQCRAWWYDPLKGRTNRRDGKRIPRTDEPCLCELGNECPLGHWKSPKGFSPRNRMAFAHWRGCRATGQFPDDPIVKRNAREIEELLYGNPVGNGSRTGRSGDAGGGSRDGDRSTAGRGRSQRTIPV